MSVKFRETWLIFGMLARYNAGSAAKRIAACVSVQSASDSRQPGSYDCLARFERR